MFMRHFLTPIYQTEARGPHAGYYQCICGRTNITHMKNVLIHISLHNFYNRVIPWLLGRHYTLGFDQLEVIANNKLLYSLLYEQ